MERQVPLSGVVNGKTPRCEFWKPLASLAPGQAWEGRYRVPCQRRPGALGQGVAVALRSVSLCPSGLKRALKASVASVASVHLIPHALPSPGSGTETRFTCQGVKAWTGFSCRRCSSSRGCRPSSVVRRSLMQIILACVLRPLDVGGGTTSSLKFAQVSSEHPRKGAVYVLLFQGV